MRAPVLVSRSRVHVVPPQLQGLVAPAPGEHQQPDRAAAGGRTVPRGFHRVQRACDDLPILDTVFCSDLPPASSIDARCDRPASSVVTVAFGRLPGAQVQFCRAEVGSGIDVERPRARHDIAHQRRSEERPGLAEGARVHDVDRTVGRKARGSSCDRRPKYRGRYGSRRPSFVAPSAASGVWSYSATLITNGRPFSTNRPQAARTSSAARSGQVGSSTASVSYMPPPPRRP